MVWVLKINVLIANNDKNACCTKKRAILKHVCVVSLLGLMLTCISIIRHIFSRHGFDKLMTSELHHIKQTVEIVVLIACVSSKWVSRRKQNWNVDDGHDHSLRFSYSF